MTELPGTGICWQGTKPRPESEWGDDQLYDLVLKEISDAGVWERVQSLSLDDLVRGTDAQIVDALLENQFQPVELVSQDPEQLQVHDGPGRQSSSGWQASKLLEIRWSLDGPSERLRFWPWKASKQPRTNTDLRVIEGRDESFDGLPNAVFNLADHHIFSYLEKFEDESVDELAQQQRKTFARRHVDLASYIDAHNAALIPISEHIREQLIEMTTKVRRKREFDKRVMVGLVLIADPAPVLELVDSPADLSLPPYRLADLTFLNIVDTINRWGKDISHGSGNLAGLNEDGLTTMLCAALTLTFGIANHGTFTHNGRSDISIPCGRLAELNDRNAIDGEPDLFLVETKKQGGGQLAKNALDQLHHYLGRSILHGTLIFYLTHDDFEKARDNILEGLRDHSDYLPRDDRTSPGGVPIFTFNDPLAKLGRSVAVICLSLPKPQTQTEEATERSTARGQGDAT